jgi:hypothetical protein
MEEADEHWRWRRLTSIGDWRVKRNEMDGDRGDATPAVGCESGVTFNLFDRFEGFSSTPSL